MMAYLHHRRHQKGRKIRKIVSTDSSRRRWSTLKAVKWKDSLLESVVDPSKALSDFVADHPFLAIATEESKGLDVFLSYFTPCTSVFDGSSTHDAAVYELQAIQTKDELIDKEVDHDISSSGSGCPPQKKKVHRDRFIMIADIEFLSDRLVLLSLPI
ncbi:hypothetical protein CCACVL1_02965 [Corchorus capsularis]|uniref:Uncharacterized protein n=1 Tax=Corchorus capsularis TaxID=210143 RepID=A0A1R3K4F6_COCAP|nr:hypothetical protein CCACVL1_02965 [Corchorus capsularis]